jgi:hypothetical protein
MNTQKHHTAAAEIESFTFSFRLLLTLIFSHLFPFTIFERLKIDRVELASAFRVFHPGFSEVVREAVCELWHYTAHFISVLFASCFWQRQTVANYAQTCRSEDILMRKFLLTLVSEGNSIIAKPPTQGGFRLSSWRHSRFGSFSLAALLEVFLSQLPPTQLDGACLKSETTSRSVGEEKLFMNDFPHLWRHTPELIVYEDDYIDGKSCLGEQASGMRRTMSNCVVIDEKL